MASTESAAPGGLVARGVAQRFGSRRLHLRDVLRADSMATALAPSR